MNCQLHLLHRQLLCRLLWSLQVPSFSLSSSAMTTSLLNTRQCHCIKYRKGRPFLCTRAMRRLQNPIAAAQSLKGSPMLATPNARRHLYQCT